jgi:hypothetical protein
VVNPADIPTTDKERKQKEDKRDSRKIARSLENGELQGIYIPSEEDIEDRALLRFRDRIGYFGDTDPHFGDIDPLRF